MVRSSLVRGCLLVLGFSLFVYISVGAPQRSPRSFVHDGVLILYDSADSYGSRCYQQTQVALRYARIPYRQMNLSVSLRLPPLDEFTSVLITTERIWRLDTVACSALEDYVRRGGGLAVLFRAWNPHLGALLGFVNKEAPKIDKAKSRGLVFTKELLPGIKDVTINDRLLEDISRYDLQLDSSSDVFATTDVGRFPVAWVRKYGAGRIIYWDSSLLAERIYRGFISASLGCIQSWTACLILNFSTVCLDDFPLPSGNEKREPIKTEFDETPSEFYSLRWYHDMMKLSRDFQIKYTAGLIFNYAEMTTPPYNFSEWSGSRIVVAGDPLNASVWTARQVSRENELAFHGHNHQPLTISRWGTEENMILALQAAKRRWKIDNLGPDPLSYVPPMNVIDSVGVRALLKVFPSIRVVAGQYMGKFELGQRREFGPEPWDNDIISIPRTTSGYVMDDFNRMITISIVSAVGVWNHFVHPDDVIPTLGRYQENVREDENLDVAGWYNEPKKDGLYYRFRSWLEFVHEHYPWLRSCTLAEARDIVGQYAVRGSTAISAGTHIRLQPTTMPAYYVVQLPTGNDVTSIEGGNVLHKESLAFTNSYVVRADEPDVNIGLAHAVESASLVGPPQGNLYAIDAMLRQGSSSSSVAETGRGSLETKTPMERAEDLIGANRHAEAVAMLEDIVSANPDDTTAWRRLGQLYAWTNLPKKEITAYENLARMAPNDRAVLKLLADRYVWADRPRNALPLYERVLAMDPRDIATMKILAQNYDWQNRQREATALYEKILQLNPKDVPIMKTLAQNYVWTDRQKDAIPIYEQLVKGDPRDVKLRKTLAELCFGNARRDDGIRQYEQILQLTPSDTSVLRILGEKYLEANRQTDAIRVDELRLVHQSGNSALQRQLAQLYLWNNAPGKAIVAYESLVALNGNDREAREILARIYVETGNLDKAIPLYETLTHLDPANVSSLKRLGELYLWKERQTEAIGVYRRIVKAEPDSIPSRLMLGRLCMWNKDPSGAKSEFLEVVRQDPRNVAAWSLLAVVEQGDGDWYSAKAHYRVVLSIEPENQEALTGIEQIRREHGLQFRTAYELTEDSNELVRERVPLGLGMLKGSSWDFGVQALRLSVLDRRLSRTELGYGLGARGQYAAARGLSVTGELSATSYNSHWVPLSLSLQADGTLSPRITSSLKVQRFETTEGVQAIGSHIYVSTVAGELFTQTTDRLSLSCAAEGNWYSDNNSKTTIASFLTYKLNLGSPQFTMLANYAYQNSAIVYATSIPYWTPSKLSTTSVGLDASLDLFKLFTLDAAYMRTLQAGVFSDNVRGRFSLKSSAFSQLLIEYEKLGSTIYSQKALRVEVLFRY